MDALWLQFNGSPFDTGITALDFVKCSVCGYMTDARVERFVENGIKKIRYNRIKQCPKCGSRMRGYDLTD